MRPLARGRRARMKVKPRPIWPRVVQHACLAAAANVVAWMIATNFDLSGGAGRGLLQTIPIAIACHAAAFSLWRVDRTIWRYAGAGDLLSISLSAALGSAAFAAATAPWASLLRHRPAVYVADALACAAFVGGVRVAARVRHER